MNRVEIRIIPAAEQRYDTLGDWWFDGEALQIRATEAEGHEPFLIALHELVEAYLCKARGVDQSAVDLHDQFCLNAGIDGEPGDAPSAPYRREHRFAMLIEHMVAHELGITGYGEVS